jgi:hypothetical protein
MFKGINKQKLSNEAKKEVTVSLLQKLRNTSQKTDSKIPETVLTTKDRLLEKLNYSKNND